MSTRPVPLRRSRWSLSLIAAAVVAGGCAAASTAQAAIEVGDDDGQVVARFDRVTCKVSNVKGKRRFHVAATSGRWNLGLTIFPGDFKGYGRFHEIRYGPDSPVDVDVWRRGSPAYSNSYRREQYETPEGTIRLPVPGRVRIRTSGKRRTVELGLGAIWNGPTSDDAVVAAGRARCR